MTIGRNEPCPCGSGKKYKKCCMAHGIDPARYTKQKLNLFHERIIGELVRHGQKVFGPEAHNEAAAEFFLWPEEEEAIDFGYQEALFYPWLLFKWMVAPDAEESSRPGPRNQTVVHSYLQHRGKKLDALEREYLENFAGAPFSFFEVTAAAPGKSIDLRDLLLDLEYRILDGKASRSLSKGDVVFGSAFTAGGIGLFGALSMITFSPAAKVEILALKDKALDHQVFVHCHQRFEAGEELMWRPVVAPFTLLEVELEISLHAIKLCQTAFCKTPECFDAVNVDRFFRKVFGFVDAEMFVVANVYQAIIAFPTVGMNNAFRRNLAPDDGLKRFFRAVCDQLCVYSSFTLIDAEDRLFKRTRPLFRGPGRPRTRVGPKKLSSTSTTPNICSFLDIWWR